MEKDKVEVDENSNEEIQKKGTIENSVTDVTDVTDVPVTSVTCYIHVQDSIFSEKTLDKILRILYNNQEGLTDDKISELTGINQSTLRKQFHDNFAYFEAKYPNGKKCNRFLSQMALDEIQSRIDNYEAKIEEKKRHYEKQQNLKKSQEEQINIAKSFFEANKKKLFERCQGNVFYINFQDIEEFDISLSDQLLAKPDKIIQIMEQAFEESGLADKCRIRIFNLPKTSRLNIENLRAEHIDNLISITGRSIRLSDVRPQAVSAKFECPSCGTVLMVPQEEKKFREPTRCSCGRRGGFKLIAKEMVDTARVVLEDLQEKTDNPYAKRINCFLKEDLVTDENLKTFYPGNEIEVVGILKEVPMPLKTGGLSTRFEIAMEVIYARKLEEEVNIETLSKEEREAIFDLSKDIDENGFNNINSSFAPDIYGHEEIKAALIMQLASKKNVLGEKKQKNKPNILLIGDPGVSKSILGDFAISITPGSKKAVGGSSSAVGITASVIKDDFDGLWTVEGGTLVLARDLAMIDELNNMSDDDKPKLQEQMSEHTITVSKATVRRVLKAPAGLLGIANPVHGYFVEEEDLVEQFHLPAPIINRFDLIFVVRDSVDESKDKKIAEKIINRERGKIKPKYSKEFLIKFFTYIKEQPNPEIDDEISERLKYIYAHLRNYKTASLNINPRVHVALLQLCKASAKLRLSSKVEEKDIERSLNLLSSSYFKTPPYDILQLKLMQQLNFKIE